MKFATATRFDTAVQTMAELAYEILGKRTLLESLILRDAEGRLTLVLRSPVASDLRTEFDRAAVDRMGTYVDGPTATPDELLDDSLRIEKGRSERISFERETLEIQLLDRRIIGQDWNAPDFNFDVGIPVITFFSCKGGVGRTTALAIAAAALSEQGANVTIIDADLEAPGIGSVLLNHEDLPEFGSLDYFVEFGMSSVGPDFLERCIAPSPLTAGRGLVEIMPAVGWRGIKDPQNVLPKLGRAFIDKMDATGKSISFLHQMQTLVRSIAERGKSNVIFVDARAGLSESSAATVVGLGGNVLMFGVDTPQTFECYRYLFAQMKSYALDGQDADWRFGLQMVHAKAGRGSDSFANFRDQAAALFGEFLYDEADPSDLVGFNFDLDDDAAPHFAWPIPFDADYAEFNPASRRDQLSKDFFSRSYGPFVEKVNSILRTYQAFSVD